MVPTQPEIGMPNFGPNRVATSISQSINVGDLNNATLAFDPEWCAETLTLEDGGKILKKNGSQHGIVFCQTPLDIFNTYIEFKVRIDAIFGGKSHLFLGMVDQSKQRQENLSKFTLLITFKQEPNIYQFLYNQLLPSGKILLQAFTGMCGR